MRSISKRWAVFLITLLVAASLCSVAFAESTSSGSIVRLTEDIYVNEGYTVEGDVVSISGNVYVNGNVKGNAVSIAGDVIVNDGTVNGDAVSVAGNVKVGQGGKVLGKTVQVLGGAYRGSGGGLRDYLIPRIFSNSMSKPISAILSFVDFLVMFIFAAIAYAIKPGRSDEISAVIGEDVGRKLGIGALAVIGLPILLIVASVVLAITIVGIIIVPFIWLAYLVALIVAVVPVYIFIGRKAAEVLGNKNPTGYGSIALGVLTLWVIRLASSMMGGSVTGFINGVISLSVLFIGAGSLMDHISKNHRSNNVNVRRGRYECPRSEDDGPAAGEDRTDAAGE